MKLNLKENNSWLQSLISIFISLLILTLGFFSIISYNGFDKNVSISAYNFVENNSKATALIDTESAKLLSEDNYENGNYASLILVSSERSHRTSVTENLSIAGVCFIICLIMVILLNIACDAMSIFEFYNKKLQILSLVLKSIVLLFGLIISIIISCYLANLPANLTNYYHIGASVVILPILAILSVINWIVFKILNSKKRELD